MKIEEEILENKGMTKMNELKLKAIINLLSKEGILTHEEVEEEVNRLIRQNHDGTPEE